MPLPNRAAFFATGLAPLQGVSDGCSICLNEPMDSPVEIQACSHKFCRACITQWLEQPNTDACPMCRRKLFYEWNLEVDPERVVHAISAYRYSGLIEGLGTLEDFGVEIPFTEDTLYRAGGIAFVDLAYGQVEVDGNAERARVSGRHLGPALVAMANLLLQFSDRVGRPYDREAWRSLVVNVWEVIEGQEGNRVDWHLLPACIMECLRTRFAAQMDEPVGVWFRDEEFTEDLSLLITFLIPPAVEAYRAWPERYVQLRSQQAELAAAEQAFALLHSVQRRGDLRNGL